jgi:hypothetical protein
MRVRAAYYRVSENYTYVRVTSSILGDISSLQDSSCVTSSRLDILHIITGTFNNVHVKMLLPIF